MVLNKDHRIPLLLFLFSFILRALLVNKGAYNVDCLTLTIQGEEFLKEWRLPYAFGFGYPLAIIMASVFVAAAKLFPGADPVMAVNFLSVIFGSLCIPTFFFLLKKLTDETTALMGSLLLSICPKILGNSLYGMTHMPALFFLLLAILFALKFVEFRHTKFLYLAAVCLGSSGAVRLQDMVLVIPALSYLIVFYRGHQQNDSRPLRKRLLHLFIFLALCIATTILFHFPYLLNQARSAYFDQLSMYQKIVLRPPSFSFFVYGYIINLMYLLQTLSPLGLVISLLSIILVARGDKYLFWLLVLWVGVPLLLFCNIFTISPRHQIVMLPAFIILECYTLRKFLLFNKFFRISSLSIFIAILLVSFLHYLPFYIFRHQHSPITEYSRWLGEVTEENARIIATDITPFLKRYAKREPMGRILKDGHVYQESELLVYKTELEGLLDQGMPIYITATGLLTYDIENKFSDFMLANFELQYVGSHIYEDWHRGYLNFQILQNSLYKLGKKK